MTSDVHACLHSVANLTAPSTRERSLSRGVSLLGRRVLLGAGFALTGCSVANFQSGLEEPTEQVLLEADRQHNESPPPSRIRSFDSFLVRSEKDVSLKVYCRESPDAIANVLFVHGAGGGAWVWEYFFDLMPARFNLYALSWRGHFDSSAYGDARVRDHVLDQEAVFKAVKRRTPLPTHVVGHSYGGATSALQAAATDQDIASLCLVAPVVPLDYTYAQSIFIPMMASWFVDAGNDAEGTFGGMFLSKTRMKRYHRLYASDPKTSGGPSIITVDGVSVCWQDELDQAIGAAAQRGVPMLMLLARYDNVVVPRRQRNTAKKHSIQLTELASGHYIPLDIKAADSVRLVTNFLDSASRGELYKRPQAGKKAATAKGDN